MVVKCLYQLKEIFNYLVTKWSKIGYYFVQRLSGEAGDNGQFRRFQVGICLSLGVNSRNG